MSQEWEKAKAEAADKFLSGLCLEGAPDAHSFKCGADFGMDWFAKNFYFELKVENDRLREEIDHLKMQGSKS